MQAFSQSMKEVLACHQIDCCCREVSCQAFCPLVGKGNSLKWLFLVLVRTLVLSSTPTAWSRHSKLHTKVKTYPQLIRLGSDTYWTHLTLSGHVPGPCLRHLRVVVISATLCLLPLVVLPGDRSIEALTLPQ
jgi:hypothetical protein